MVGITIENKHSFNDYGLILSSKSIAPPTTKTITVDVAGGDGVLDLTEYFGEPKYNNRAMSFVFNKPYPTLIAFINDWSYLQDELNGKKVHIILDEDPRFYYYGRISLSYTKTKNIATITMDVDAEPYRMKIENTVVEQEGSGTVILKNQRKKVVPNITTTAETQIYYKNSVYNLSEGEWVIPELELVAGDNSVQIVTSGTVTFTYQEGGF